MKFLPKWLIWIISLAAGGISVASVVIVAAVWSLGKDLPDYSYLAEYRPPTMSRIYSADGVVLSEFATERRIFVPIGKIPERLRLAFLAAEDQDFYSHPGVDFQALVRAMIGNVERVLDGRRPHGASTITQQVARLFLLSNELSIVRKVREAILAFRIESTLGKDRILELYLNEIYLGSRVYGVASAAYHYFDKPLSELMVAEIAYLAGLPKAPNNYHPDRNHGEAVGRRNWVIRRMREEGIISRIEEQRALAAPLEVADRLPLVDSRDSAYFVQDIRSELINRYGQPFLEAGGLTIHTTLDSRLQRMAVEALSTGLMAYDRRHGWRGPLSLLENPEDWYAGLQEFERPAAPEDWLLAAVLSVQEQTAQLGLADGRLGIIPLEAVGWAREQIYDPEEEKETFGPEVTHMSQVLKRGDVVFVTRRPGPPRAPIRGVPFSRVQAERYGGSINVSGVESLRPLFLSLEQVPEVSGAILAMDPHSGRIRALQGGWNFEHSQFNRARQAWRQPGSAFKPFVYLAALEQGLTPDTIILDAPFVIDQGADRGKWKPANYSGTFYGPSLMRIGIEKSRNLMTIRLAQAIGMKSVRDMALRLNVVDRMPGHLSMALGAGETSLSRLLNAYSMLVNGGRRVEPVMLERIQDRDGITILKRDDRNCALCVGGFRKGSKPPVVPVESEQLIHQAHAYQIVSMLEGVVKRGTGRSISILGRPLAGKTGTTNESRDVWFMGFSPDLAVGIFVGFDLPKPLGRSIHDYAETGSSVAAPIFLDFMRDALENEPVAPFRTPPEVRMVRVDLDTGRPARPGARNVILEAFQVGTEPGATTRNVFLNDGQVGEDGAVLPTSGQGLEQVAPDLGVQQGIY